MVFIFFQMDFIVLLKNRMKVDSIYLSKFSDIGMKSLVINYLSLNQGTNYY
jgi:hypothetical protein